MIRITTSMGVVDIELDYGKAPVSSKNFERYVQEGFYAGTLFHRVIDGFMIQGGGFTKGMKEKATHEPIKLESGNGLSNRKYTVAMARTSDPDSATSQFYINVADNTFLDKSSRSEGYAVFGKVVAGTDVVDRIKAVRTARRGWYDDVPVDDVVIEKAEVIEQ